MTGTQRGPVRTQKGAGKLGFVPVCPMARSPLPGIVMAVRHWSVDTCFILAIKPLLPRLLWHRKITYDVRNSNCFFLWKNHLSGLRRHTHDRSTTGKIGGATGVLDQSQKCVPSSVLISYWHNNFYVRRPTLSVPSERMFSKSGDVVSKTFNRLSPESVEERMFPYQNHWVFPIPHTP